MSNESREGSDQMLIWKARYHPLQNIARNIKSKARQKRRALMPFHILGADAGNLFLQGGGGWGGMGTGACPYAVLGFFYYFLTCHGPKSSVVQQLVRRLVHSISFTRHYVPFYL